MPIVGLRCEFLDKKVRREIVNLFGSVKAAYRNLDLNSAQMTYHTVRRALAQEECRIDDIETIERIWAEYKMRHNFGEELDYDPDTIPAAERRAMRRGRGTVIEIEEGPITGSDFERAEFD